MKTTASAAILTMVGFVIVAETLRPSILVEPFEAPQTLRRGGLSGSIVANRLIDHIEAIAHGAGGFSSDQRLAIATGSDFPEFVVPNTGLSAHELVAFGRHVLRGQSSSISGEITERGDDLLVMVRLNGERIFASAVRETQLDSGLAAAARVVMGQVRPELLAASLFKGGNYKAADSVARRMLMVAPDSDDASALNILGAVMAQEGRYADAIPYYRQAIGLSRHHYAARFNLGNALEGLAHASEGSERPEEATDYYNEALQSLDSLISDNPAFAPAYISWAQIALELPAKSVNASLTKRCGAARRVDCAIAIFDEGLRRDPTDVTAYRAKGFSLYLAAVNNHDTTAGSAHEFAAAGQALDAVTTRNVRDVDAALFAALSFEKRGQFSQALRRLNRLLPTEPTARGSRSKSKRADLHPSARLLASIAQVWYDSAAKDPKQYRLALKGYCDATRSSFGDPAAHFGAANAFAKLDRLADAKSEYRIVASLGDRTLRDSSVSILKSLESRMTRSDRRTAGRLGCSALAPRRDSLFGRTAMR